jgi:hypothetical protein
MRLEEVSAKVRTGPPVDDEADHSLPVWAGVIPIVTQRGEPIPAPGLAAEQRFEWPTGPGWDGSRAGA